MAQFSQLKFLMVLFLAAAAAMSVVSAQESQMAPAPAPVMDKGAAPSLQASSTFMGSVLIVSLMAMLKH